MKIRTIVAALAVVAFAIPCTSSRATSQTTTYFPSTFRNVESPSRTAIPFGLSQPVRVQSCYHAPVPGNARAASITEISIRADGNPNVAIAAKPFVNVELVMSHCPRAYTELSRKFDENRGAATVKAFEGKITLPAQPMQTTATPRPFNLTFKLKRPFIHWNEDDGYLLIEFVIINQPKGNYYLDVPNVCASQAKPFGKIDRGKCRLSNNKPLELSASTNVQLGGGVTWTLKNALPNSGVMFVMGTRETGPFDSPTRLLPLALGPAPGCYANTDWAMLFPKAANSIGEARNLFQLPNNERFRNATLRCQAVALDLAANAMGVVWSEGLKTTICGPSRCARVIGIGDVTKVKEGIVQIGSAPILEIKYN